MGALIFALIQDFNHWQICAIAIWLLLQGAFFAVIPEEVIMLSMGVLWSQGRVGFFESFAALLIGLLPANSCMVFISGRFAKKSLVQKPLVQAALKLARARGAWVIFMTRFTPFVRGPVYAAIGLSGMRVFDFFKLDILAAFVQVPLLVLIGAYIGQKAGSITAAYKVIGLSALSLLGLFLLAYAAQWWRKRKQVGQA